VVRKRKTVSLEMIKNEIRRGNGGGVENHCGWCVYVDASGHHSYVVDENNEPVSYSRVGILKTISKQVTKVSESTL
jgi:hypothetical protein